MAWRERARKRSGAEEVFPAPAGMNRVFYQTGDFRMRVPRACGDEPLIEREGVKGVTCSPRLRG